jgi:hypothetical protein
MMALKQLSWSSGVSSAAQISNAGTSTDCASAGAAHKSITAAAE